MKVLHSVKETLQFIESTPIVERTLKYVFDFLHNSCYLLVVKDHKGELFKLEASDSPSLARKTLKHKSIKNPKTMRVMQCVVKHFKKTATTTSEYPRFIESIHLPNGIFLLNLTDTVLLKKDRTVPWPILGKKSIPDEFHKPMLPIFGGSGAIGFEDIPIPNYDDILFCLKPTIPTANLDWSTKIPKVVFRGGSTGCGITPETNMRLKLVNFNFEWLDAGITTKTQLLKYDPVKGLGMVDSKFVKKRPFLDFNEQSNYKFIVHIDGNVAAFRLLKWFMTGSVILKVQGDYTLWYEHLLEDKKNVVFVKSDLSDLESVFEWCLNHDSECKKIAMRGYKLGQKLLKKSVIEKAFSTLLNNEG